MKSYLVPPALHGRGSYEAATATIRWLCLGLILLTFPYDHQPASFIVFIIVVVVALMNFARRIRRVARLPFFASRANSLALDHLLVLTLVVLSGGLASPYYVLFFVLVVSVIDLYGAAGLAFAVASQLVIGAVLLFVPTQPLPADRPSQLIIRLVLLALFALVTFAFGRTREREASAETRFVARVGNERQRLLALINSLSSAVLALDGHGKVYLYNAAALELLNTNRDISGDEVDTLLPLQTSLGEPVSVLKLAADNKGLNRQDLIFVADDDSKLILDITLSPVHEPGFRPHHAASGGFMLVFHDITKQKTLDEERDEFIAVSSHELRTPLAIAEANLSTALLPGFAKMDPKAKQLIEQAHQNTVFLSELITDLTSLSRAERGALKTEAAMIDINQLAEELGHDYSASAKAKGLGLEVRIDQAAKTVVTSPHELREILQNFLTNAIKYTEKGAVTLAVVAQPTGVAVSVKDTGIGLSASDKKKIFQKFYRSEDYRTRKTGGTGLGLYITKKLVEHLGLTLDFDSRLNQGSSFTVVIPYNTDKAPSTS